MHKSAAWPLVWVYVGLIFYASLYPFADWRNQGIEPWGFLLAPVPRYWTGFDVAINVVGYAPLGALLTLGALRSGHRRHALWAPVVMASLLAFLMENLQNYLPMRIPSREDWLFNTLGGCLGTMGMWVLARLGVIDHWSQMRARWFMSESRGGIVLLLTWPLALIFPAAVPFGLGQVLERVDDALVVLLDGTPFLDWFLVRRPDLQPLIPGAEMLCVLLGLLIPCLLGFCVIHTRKHRAVFVVLVAVAGCFVTALSAALSWGPEHAWAWLSAPTQLGMGLALLLALVLVVIPWRGSAALLLLALGVHLSLLNQAPEGAYFAQTLQDWEQGRFIRFHGLAQWLGWLWPYAALVYVLALIWQEEATLG